MVHAECLPTEIWFEIFGYLSAHDNIRAFSNLNRFFDGFASTKYFGVHLHLTKDKYPRNFSRFFYGHIELRTIRQLSASQGSHLRLNELLRFHADKLIHLQKLSIYLRKKMMRATTFYLTAALERLASLKSVEIRSHVPDLDSWRMRDLLITLFSKRLALTHCRLHFSLEYHDLRRFPWSGRSSIRFLILEKISWSNLLLILNRTKDLLALETTIAGFSFEPTTLILPSLRKLVLNINRMPFAALVDIRRLAPRLQFFSFYGLISLNDENYFQEDSWRKLLDTIHFYDILLENGLRSEDDKELAKRIHNLLSQKQWVQLTVDDSWLRMKIVNPSK